MSGRKRIKADKDPSTKFVISYLEARAKKDKANREKGLRKLEKQLRSGKLTKANINNRGYNKYLKLQGDVRISIGRAFRIYKSDLRIRPVYHRLQRRIEAHICIAFAAYKTYKELERQLKIKKTNLSPEKAIEIAKTIYASKVQTPVSGEILQQTLILNQEQKLLAELFDL